MRLRTLAALMVALFLASPLAAQELRGSIEGVVKDTSGAVLPGATVEAKTDTGVVLSSATDAGGIFRFPSVPPGMYEVTATLQGFAPGKAPGVDHRPRTSKEGRLRARPLRASRNPWRSRRNRHSST